MDLKTLLNWIILKISFVCREKLSLEGNSKLPTHSGVAEDEKTRDAVELGNKNSHINSIMPRR